MINYELSFLIAVLAFVYSYLLTQPHMIFNPLYKALSKKLVKETCNGTKMHWLFKVIIHCERCVAGQLSLWLYLLLYWNRYNPLAHVLFVGMTIFLVSIIKGLYVKHIEE